MKLSRFHACSLVAAFLSFTAVLQAQSQKSQEAADAKEIQSQVLTMESVTRTFQALYEMKQAISADPTLQAQAKKNSESDDQQKSLDQMGALIGSSPKLTAIAVAHGFTPRSLAVSEMSVIQTSIALMAANAGAKDSDLAGTAGVNPANLKLFREHKAEVEALSKKYPISSD